MFDAAFLAGTVASLMMNGACCYYQSHREDELRDDLREEIRREWYLQRKREKRMLEEVKEKKSSDFEDHYQQLLHRRCESYTERRIIGGSGSKASSYSMDSIARPPYSNSAQRKQQLDQPAYHAFINRTSSILEEEDQDTDTKLMFVTDAGSDTGSLEDVSIHPS